MKKSQKSAGIKGAEFPKYCDFSCKYAGFAPADSIGACRKELAVWCKYFNKYNNKNRCCLNKG